MLRIDFRNLSVIYGKTIHVVDVLKRKFGEATPPRVHARPGLGAARKTWQRDEVDPGACAAADARADI